MNLKHKVIAVTGAGSGIGRAFCERFDREAPAAIAVLDLNAQAAVETASALSAPSLGLSCNVSDEEQLSAAIERVETEFGPIDLFCSNAGLLLNDPHRDDPASADDSAWTLSWQVHVMAHIYAARILGPGMAQRGHGWFLNTISAAGLLTQIGSGPYSVTKHAAVGFAESLAIAYKGRGVGVSILCPQGVATPMVAGAQHTPAVADGLLTPEAVADAALEGLATERFMILPHPQVAEYMQRKASDYDRWISGMARFRDRLQTP